MDILSALVQSKPKGVKERGASTVAKSSDDFYALYPLLYRLMTEEKIGEVDRRLSKIGICLKGEGFVLSLTEPASGQICFSTSDTLIRCFEVIEGRLASGEADWRPDKYAKARRKGK